MRLTHLPTGIAVARQQERSQHQNRAKAVETLKVRLYELELQKREVGKLAQESARRGIVWGRQITSYVLQLRHDKLEARRGRCRAIASYRGVSRGLAYGPRDTWRRTARTSERGPTVVDYYSEEQLAQITAAFATVPARSDALSYRCVTHRYSTPEAHEFAMQGFLRRLNTLVFCIENVFQIMPPDGSVLSSRRQSYECMINIQAFVFNIFGSLDNLAWVLVHEKQITDAGKPLGKHAVGLAAKHKALRAALSPALAKYLDEKSGWFEQLGGFRDALAHRIPLYVPPVIVEANKGQYEEIQKLKGSASQDEYESLDQQEAQLYRFVPVMTHSHTEAGSAIVQFHPQMLADFALVVEVASNCLDELAQSKPPPSTLTQL